MRVQLFDFALPSELIAQAPIRPRDAARLLLVDGGLLRETVVRDLPNLLSPRDLLVLNDTRVLPTRFFALRGEVPVEVTLIERIDAAAWWALARPGKRFGDGARYRHAGRPLAPSGSDSSPCAAAKRPKASGPWSPWPGT